MEYVDDLVQVSQSFQSDASTNYIEFPLPLSKSGVQEVRDLHVACRSVTARRGYFQIDIYTYATGTVLVLFDPVSSRHQGTNYYAVGHMYGIVTPSTGDPKLRFIFHNAKANDNHTVRYAYTLRRYQNGLGR